jgi:hypothetical protein
MRQLGCRLSDVAYRCAAGPTILDMLFECISQEEHPQGSAPAP